MSLIPDEALYYDVKNQEYGFEIRFFNAIAECPANTPVTHIGDFPKQLGMSGYIGDADDHLSDPKQEEPREFSHYFKEIVPGVSVDVYQVCDAFKMPAAVDHAVKKCLASGNRGYKDQRQDIEEAIKSLRRQLEIIDVWA